MVAEVGQDSSEHVSELEEQASLHEDPEYTHFAPDETLWRKSVALDTFQPPMLRLNVAPAEENIELRSNQIKSKSNQIKSKSKKTTQIVSNQIISYQIISNKGGPEACDRGDIPTSDILVERGRLFEHACTHMRTAAASMYQRACGVPVAAAGGHRVATVKRCVCARARAPLLASVVALATFQPPMSWLNALLLEKTDDKLVSWATFHPRMSWLNADE